jgi:hypothetical protein
MNSPRSENMKKTAQSLDEKINKKLKHSHNLMQRRGIKKEQQLPALASYIIDPRDGKFHPKRVKEIARMILEDKKSTAKTGMSPYRIHRQ